MSTENVSLFLQSIEQNEELCARVCAVDPDESSWAGIAAEEGYEFSDKDFHEFVCLVLDQPDLSQKDAMQSFLKAYAESDEISDEDLENVAGGAFSWSSRFRFTRSLSNRMQSLGFASIGGTSRTVAQRTVGISSFTARTVF